MAYTPIPIDEKKAGKSDTSSDEGESEDDSLIPHQSTVRKERRRQRLRAIIFGLSYFVAIGVTYATTKHLSQCVCPGDEPTSPFMAGIDRSYHEEMGNSAHAVSSDPSNPDSENKSWNNFTISTDIGGDEIESWWLDLGAYTAPVLLPEQYAEQHGFDPKKHSLIRPTDPDAKPGTIPYAGYPASIGVMHYLHCINFMRQAVFHNHQYYRNIHGKPWRLKDPDLARHLGHCVDILRQKFLCDADVELIPFEKTTGHHARNDWVRPMKCRNFFSLRSWLADHQWSAGDPDFYLDDHHIMHGRPTVTKLTEHSFEELWRGY